MVIIFMLLVGILVLFWKFSKGPIDITFAADSIKSALVSEEHKSNITFDGVVAEWPEFSGPISIGMSGVSLIEDGRQVLNIPQIGIRVSKAPLLIGEIKPEVIIIKNPMLKLIRSPNEGIHMRVLGNDKVNKNDVVTSNKQKTSLKDLGESFFRGGTLPDYPQIKPLSELEVFKIEQSHIEITDNVLNKKWAIPQLNFQVKRDENFFTLTADYEDGYGNPSKAEFYIEKYNQNGDIRFSSDIDQVNLSTLGQIFLPFETSDLPDFFVQSQMEGILDSNWNFKNFEAALSSGQGQLILDDIYQSPLTLANLKGNFLYDKASNKISLQNTSVTINNHVVSLSGEKDTSDKTPVFKLMGKIPDLSFDELQALWPNTMRKSLAADWLTNRLKDAKVTNFVFAIPLNLQNLAQTNSSDVRASLEYTGLTADYRAPLFPVTQASGKAELKDDVLTIDVTSGKLGEMSIKSGKIIIPHLTHPTEIGDATIEASLTGNISDALRYIREEPIAIDDEIGIDPKTVSGTAEIKANVSFPVLKELPKELVKVSVEATLNNLILPKIARGMDLTGGPYTLTVTDKNVILSGKGQLGGQPINLEYSEAIERSTAEVLTSIKADIVANKFLRDKYGVNVSQFIDGDVPVNIDYKLYNTGRQLINIKGDLTPATLRFSPFRYSKKAGHPAQMEATAKVQGGQIQSITNLSIAVEKSGSEKAGSIKGDINFGKVGSEHDVKSGRFSNITIGGENQFSLDFVQSSSNVYDVQIKGKRLDARPFLTGGASSYSKKTAENNSPSQARVNVVVDVQEIKTGQDLQDKLSKPKLSLKTNNNGDIEFLELSGQFDGGNLQVSIKPNQASKIELRILSDNAGRALQVLDLYDQMIGGKLDVRGTQIQGAGINDIQGRAIITDFTIIRAPILAKLINLFSLSGLTELLQNKGIEFEALKTDFQWRESNSGRVIAVNNGKTSGASIGLTFGGTVYQDTGKTDLSGTVIPISELNNFVNKIPIIGNLLTGGKNGGVIAATYSLKGDSDDPSLTINPLSVLTPGFLRSILFEKNDSDGGYQEPIGSHDQTQKIYNK
jgi:hypothetical protein